MIQFSNLISLVAVLFLLILVWVGSISYTYWDVMRRPISERRQIAWLAVVTLLPIVGLLIYLSARFLIPALRRQPEENPPKRVTLPLRVDRAPDNEQLQGHIRIYDRDQDRGDFKNVSSRRPPSEEPPLSTIAAVPESGETIAAAVPYPQAKGGSPKRPEEKGSFKLIVAEGPQVGKIYALDQLPLAIGRGQEAAIRLGDDPTVSRRHAEITRQEGQIFIRDLNSTHGTQVNGYPIFHQQLNPGDRIQVGGTVLVLEENPGPAAMDSWRRS